MTPHPRRHASQHSPGLGTHLRRPRLRLQLSQSLNKESGGQILAAAQGLPKLFGRPISVTSQPKLTAHRGKLLSASGRGTPVHAASFIRRREIVLETELLRRPVDLRLIVVHEIFHFVWAAAGNRTRREYTAVIAAERKRGSRGELGESSSVKKALVTTADNRQWREYVCESFCDTAAWCYSGTRRHSEFALAPRWAEARRAWFTQTFGALN